MDAERGIPPVHRPLSRLWPLRAVATALVLLLSPGICLAEGGRYSIIDLLSREAPARDVEGFPAPVEVLTPALADEGGGWSTGFSDRWHASEAFTGEYRREFSSGLVWYLQTRGFEVGGGQDAIQVRVIFTGFEGRKRISNDGGDLRGIVEVLFRREVIARESLYETRTYKDESDERRTFAKSLGLEPVPFETVLFYRLSRGFYEAIARTLLESRPEIVQSLTGTRSVDAPPEGSGQPPAGRESRVGYLSIQSDPDHAEIYIDGFLIATTPAPDVKLEAGVHELVIRKEGHEDWTRSLKVLEGNRLVLRASLKPSTQD